MNSLKTSLMTKSILAAVVAASGMAAPAIGATLTPVQVNIPGTPDDGMVCRTGYATLFGAANIKCTKTVGISIVLECNNLTFPTYVIRAATNAFDRTGGQDLCIRSGPNAITISSTDTLRGLTESTNGTTGDYEYANVSPARLTERSNNQRQTEATALGLTLSEVDTLPFFTVIQLGGGTGVKDNASVSLAHYTFATRTSGPIVIGNPGPFVPLALPR